MANVGYTPSAWGTLFHNLPYEEVLGAGSAGGGKTFILLADPFPQIFMEHERCQNKQHPYHMDWGDSMGWALHLRRTLKMLKQSIQRTHRMFPAIDPGAHWSESETTWTFSSGYKYQFGHCKDSNSWQDFMSSEFQHLAFDELVQFNEEQYRQICTRVRSADPVLAKMLKIRAMSNPTMTMDSEDSFAVEDPHWVRKYFVDPAPEGKTVIERQVDMEDGTFETVKRMYFPATIDDNPDKAFVKQYKIKLASQPKHIREALLKGNWYYTPGSFYGSEWNERIHTCVPFRVPQDWPVFRSMDWGYKHYGCVHWWTLDDDDNLYCIRELRFIEKRDEEVAKMVKQIEETMGLWRNGRSAITGPADTQLWEQRGNTSRSMAHNFARKGVSWAKCDKGKTQQRNAELLLGRLKDHRDVLLPLASSSFARAPTSSGPCQAFRQTRTTPQPPRTTATTHTTTTPACMPARTPPVGGKASPRPADRRTRGRMKRRSPRGSTLATMEARPDRVM